MVRSLENYTKEKTFYDITNEWLLYKRHQVKESTYRLYQYRIMKYLQKYFDKNIVDFMYYDFNIFVDDLLEDYEVKTVRDIVSILKSILKYAERKYELDFKLDLIIMPRLTNKNVEILSKDDENKIKQFCNKSIELRDIGILVCLYTGIRIGEICALNWKNIDLKNKVIYISKTMERVYTVKKYTYIYIGEPKSKSSFRTIPLKESLVKILKDLKIRNNFQDDDFFLSGKTNKFIEPRNYQYWFKKRLKKLDVKSNKFHILRHTFATNCIQAGMDVKSLSEILGHSNANITLNRYVHSSYEVQKKYLEML